MTNSNESTNFEQKLIDLSETSLGFSASEVTGFSPESVRRAAERLVKDGQMVRFKLSPRRVRYFSTTERGQAYVSGKQAASAVQGRSLAGSRVKAQWRTDEPGIITPRTKIVVAPPLPRNVYRTYTHPQF